MLRPAVHEFIGRSNLVLIPLVVEPTWTVNVLVEGTDVDEFVFET
jgi:hypothetical protein